METKDFIGLALAAMAIMATTLAVSISARARALAFTVMVAGCVLSEQISVTFFCQYWYRGSTRGFELTFVDILAIGLLIGSLIAPRPGAARPRWPASLGFLLVWFLYGCFSVAISEPQRYGFFELSKILRGMVIFLAVAWYVAEEQDFRRLARALALAVIFEGGLAFKERVLNGVYRVTGSLDHPNSLSMYLCLTAPVLLAAVSTAEWPKPTKLLCGLALALAVMTEVFTVSRAGIPAFLLVLLGAGAACCSLRPTPATVAKGAVILLAFCGFLFKSWGGLMARYGEASMEEEYLDPQYDGRGVYLRLAGVIIDERTFGVGLNNWSYWVSKRYGAKLGIKFEDYDDTAYKPSKEELASVTYAAPAHNLGALTAGELGVPGAVLLGVLWIKWLGMGSRFVRRRGRTTEERIGTGIFFGFCGVFLQSLTEWIFRQTPIYLTFHILLGTTAALIQIRRDRLKAAAEEFGEAAEEPFEEEAAVFTG